MFENYYAEYLKREEDINLAKKYYPIRGKFTTPISESPTYSISENAIKAVLEFMNIVVTENGFIIKDIGVALPILLMPLPSITNNEVDYLYYFKLDPSVTMKPSFAISDTRYITCGLNHQIHISDMIDPDTFKHVVTTEHRRILTDTQYEVMRNLLSIFHTMLLMNHTMLQRRLAEIEDERNNDDYDSITDRD